VLSQWKRIFLLFKRSPNTNVATTIGNNSNKVMSSILTLTNPIRRLPFLTPVTIKPNSESYSTWTICEKLNICICRPVTIVKQRNTIEILKEEYLIPHVELIKRLQNDRPTTIARQRKFSEPIRDCIALRVVFFWLRISFILSTTSCILSLGFWPPVQLSPIPTLSTQARVTDFLFFRLLMGLRFPSLYLKIFPYFVRSPF